MKRNTAAPRFVIMLEIDYHDERLVLSPERAVWWPAKQTLLVADPHFGKDATFRGAGIPLPAAAQEADLARLRRLVAETRAERLIVLGDLLHARAGRTEATWTALRAWRREHASLAWLNLRGNHDRRAGDAPEDLRIDCLANLIEPPFTLCHDAAMLPSPSGRGAGGEGPPRLNEPQRLGAIRAAIAGHIHPAALLRGPQGERLRLPCFHIAPSLATLPAFGRLTGTHAIRPRAEDRLYVIAGGEVLPR